MTAPSPSGDIAAQLAAPDEPNFSFWGTIWADVRGYRLQLLAAAFCTLLCGAACSIQPLIVAFIIDRGLTRPGADTAKRFRYLAYYSLAYLALSAFRMAIWYVGYSQLQRTKELYLFTLRSRFFRHIQYLCLRFHDQVSSGELFSYLFGTPLSTLANFLQQFVMNVPLNICSWLVALVILMRMDVPMTFLLLATSLGTYFLSRKGTRRLKDISSNFMRMETSVSGFVADMLRGCRAIKLYSMADQVTWDFDSRVDLIRGESLKLTLTGWRESAKAEAMQYLGLALLYTAGGYSVLYRGMTLGSFVAFISSATLLMAPVASLIGIYLMKGNAEAALERISRILRTETATPQLPPPPAEIPLSASGRRVHYSEAPIEFDAVTFAYREEPVLRDLTVSLRPRESVALVGRSGSGKSTFVSLLLRFYDPQRGVIRLAGEDIRTLPLEKYRAAFGVVPQGPFLFQTTLAENIRAARPNASRAEVVEAARMANALEFIERFDQGFETRVGEGGTGLSGGQRQRIAIARAILANPDFFVFDEATSALDTLSESVIQKAIEHLMRERLTIIVAHRLSTIRNVGRILVFERGRIVQDGPFAELSERPGPFRNLLRGEEGPVFLGDESAKPAAEEGAA